MKHRHGFTMIEIIISTFLILLVLGGLVFISNNYLIYQQLDNVASEVIEEIRRAQGDAIASTGDSSHGIKVFGNNIIRFRGANYAQREQVYDVVTTFPGFIQFGGDDEIVFIKSKGIPDLVSSMTISNDLEMYTLTLSTYGLLEITRGAVTP